MKISSRQDPQTQQSDERIKSIWLFLAVALVPLLLSFWGGFSLGDTREMEKVEYKQKYLDAQKRLADLEAAIITQQNLFHDVDSVLEIKLKDLDAYQQTLTGLMEGGALPSRDQLFESEQMEIQKSQAVKGCLMQFEADNLNEKSLTKQADKVVFKYLNKIQEAERRSVSLRWMSINDLYKKNALGDLSAQSAALDAKLVAMQGSNKELQIAGLQKDVLDLKDRLARCQADVGVKTTDKTVVQSNHKAEADKIIANVRAAKTALGLITDNRWKNDRPGIERAKADISATLEDISTAALSIKSIK